MSAPQDFKSLQESVQKSLVSTVRTVNRIAAEDLSFQRTVNPDVARQLEGTSGRMLALSNRLLQSAAKACGVKAPPKLEDGEDIDINWRGIVDVVDSVLEKADTAMDEYTGLVKRKEPPTNADSGSGPKRQKATGKVIRNANISKPQAKFERQPDNFPSDPWKPTLATKPHATVPLEQSLVTITADNGSKQYKHPYETEITNMEYPSRLYEHAEPIPPQPVDTTKATWVDTFEGVLEMLEELKEAQEIAVDLEHHDFRTYVGLVSLMQISTRKKDWIVDTLQPWRHKLDVLNEVFADPAIVKVFHGAYMDMIWLQRDLGLYVNGLFDTYFACELLYSARSLAFLLSKFVDFDADKQYQLADWRMRPLPEEMLYYARSDTHYLLYIYDRVRNDLIEASDRSNPETDLIGRVLQKSRELSLSRHEHPGYDEESGEGPRGWANYILKHSHLNYNGEQFAIFRAIWKWRDDTARKEDESANFVLGTSHLSEIARVNPPDAKALHSLLPQTAPMARSRLNELWQCVQAAKAKGGPSLAQFFASIPPESVRKNGLPRIAKALAQLPEAGESVAASRLSQSQLFGNMPISSKWEASRNTSKDEVDGHFPFPWQRFVQDAPVAAEPQEQATNGTSEADEVAAVGKNVAAASLSDSDPEFTLKRGMKRKSEDISDQSSSDEEDTSSSGEDQEDDKDEEELQGEAAPSADEAMDDAPDGVISIDEEDPLGKLSKKQRKKQRQAEKAAEEERRLEAREAREARKASKKEQKAKQKMEQEKKYSAVPFDYSQAASVMHAARDANGPGDEDAGKKKKKQKIFDPYSKSAEEGVKGARRAPPVRGERSATFKK